MGGAAGSRTPSDLSRMDSFPATRDAALSRLEEFLPLVSCYGARRNFVARGHENVSRLSAAIRHRLLSEEEVIRAVLAVHDFAGAEKFVQEVLWRTYWKGWLEQRPGVWLDYSAGLRGDVVADVAGRMQAVQEGRSGCAAMDGFARELVETGYLHNHARMWWASYWIHVCCLPWRYGAGFFLRHLLDGDAASNTLGWRWVAGIQTKGKPYLVRASNVAKYGPELDRTGIDLLAEDRRPVVVKDAADVARRGIAPEEEPSPNQAHGRLALLLHDEDLSVETSEVAACRPDALGIFMPHLANGGDSPRARWLAEARADASARASDVFGRPCEALVDGPTLAQWVGQQQLGELVLMRPCVGPLRDQLEPSLAAVKREGVAVVEQRRPWDRRLFPLAQTGFFPFWHQARKLLR